MDFTTRPVNSPSNNRFAPVSEHSESNVAEKKKTRLGAEPTKPGLKHKDAWTQTILMIFLLCLVALIAATLLIIAFSSPNDSKFVNTGEFQSVEIAGGQGGSSHYLGNITTIGDDYMVLDNAYAVTASTSGTNPVTVMPLACTNGSSRLVLNRARTVLWSNLPATSDAAQAVKTFNANNPNGKCPANTLPAPSSTAEPVAPADNLKSGSPVTTESSTTSPNTPVTNPPATTSQTTSPKQ